MAGQRLCHGHVLSSHSWGSCRENYVDGVSSIQEHVDVRAELRPRGNSSYAPGDHYFGTSLRIVAGGGWHISGAYIPRQADPITDELGCGAPLPVDCGGDVALERGATLSLTAVKRGRSFLAGYQFGHFYGASPPESPPGVCYVGEGDPELGDDMTGRYSHAFGNENTRGRIEFPVARLTRESFSVTGTPALPDPDACASEYLTACTQSGRFVWKLTFEATKGGLSADAGGPYTALRGRRLRLDGSRSSPRGRIDSYPLDLRAGGHGRASGPAAPAGRGPADPGARGPGRRLQDRQRRQDGQDAQGPAALHDQSNADREGWRRNRHNMTTITVKPRDWQTPVTDLEPERYKRWGQPQHGSPDGSSFGLNVPGCGGAARSTRDLYFCPLPDGTPGRARRTRSTSSRIPTARTTATGTSSRDPSSRSAGASFVNAYLYAGAGVPAVSKAPTEFYAANRDAGFPIDDFIRYVQNHEGPGQGLPRSGHTQAIVDAIRIAPDANDPQRVIESVVEPSERAASRESQQAAARRRGARLPEYPRSARRAMDSRQPGRLGSDLPGLPAARGRGLRGRSA